MDWPNCAGAQIPAPPLRVTWHPNLSRPRVSPAQRGPTSVPRAVGSLAMVSAVTLWVPAPAPMPATSLFCHGLSESSGDLGQGTSSSLRKETLWEMELAAGGDTEGCPPSMQGPLPDSHLLQGRQQIQFSTFAFILLSSSCWQVFSTPYLITLQKEDF